MSGVEWSGVGGVREVSRAECLLVLTAPLVDLVCWPHSSQLFVYVPSVRYGSRQKDRQILLSNQDADEQKKVMFGQHALNHALWSPALPLTPYTSISPYCNLHFTHTSLRDQGIKGKLSVKMRLLDGGSRRHHVDGMWWNVFLVSRLNAIYCILFV